MNEKIALVDRLAEEHTLAREEYLTLITDTSCKITSYISERARLTKEKYYGNNIFIRGLIEISSICKNDCYYCGLRASNKTCERYRLGEEDILECCRIGYSYGFRTFVMQGGEDGYFTDDRLCAIIDKIKRAYPDCAVTLSLGERSCDSYRRLKEAGADRYLLRHETISPEHYALLHPDTMRHERRLECLQDLRALGYQVGCGFMVGSPGQNDEMLADEMKFIESFKPDMCGIGPFIPHSATPFRDKQKGSVETTLRLLSIIRLIHPRILLPATTALGTLDGDGRERGIMAGANVVMPNLSPSSVRKKYMLYDNKLSDGDEAAEAIASLSRRMESIGCNIAVARGDVAKETQN